MEDDMKRHYQIPAFGDWDFSHELPITQYFESARQAGLIRGQYCFYEDVDLFKVPEPVKPATVKPANNYHHQQHRKARRVGGVKQQQQQGKEHQEKHRRVRTSTPATPKRPRAPKAVDEDLYKIPPELLSRKPHKKKLLGSFWTGCLGLNCIP